MIGHKAVGMDLPVGFLASLSQGLDEILPVHIVEEDSLAPVAAAHKMIHRTRVLEAQGARHAGGITLWPECVKTK